MTLERLEQVARKATADLWADTERDVEWPAMLADLRQARRRRRLGWLAATAAAVTVVLTIAAVAAAWPSRRAVVPARPALPTHELLLVQGDRGLMTLGQGTLPHLPVVRVRPETPSSPVAVSPDGTRIAYTSDGLRVMDLRTGTSRRMGTCAPGCRMAWTPDSSALLVLSDGEGLVRIDVATASSIAIALPPAWSGFWGGLDVSPQGRVVFPGRVDHQQAVLTVDVSGANPAVVRRFPRDTMVLVIDPVWSPDGWTIAYLRKDEPAWPSPSQTVQRVEQVGADGTEVRTLATLGVCYCLQAGPALDWSPSGRLAAVVVGQGTETSVVEILPNGTTRSLGAGHGPIAWYPGSRPDTAPAPASGVRRTEALVVGLGDELGYSEAPGTMRLPSPRELDSLAFSPDGVLVAWSREGAITVSDPDSGRQVRRIACAPSSCPLAWTPDGQSVLTTGAGALRRVDVATGDESTIPFTAAGRVVALDVSPSGRVLAETMDNPPVTLDPALWLLDLNGSAPVLLERFTDRVVRSPQWSPDGRTIAYLRNSTGPGGIGDWWVELQGADGSHVRRLATIARNCCGGVRLDLAWSPSGRMAVAGKSLEGTGAVYEVTPRGTLIPKPGWGFVVWRPAS